MKRELLTIDCVIATTEPDLNLTQVIIVGTDFASWRADHVTDGKP